MPVQSKKDSQGCYKQWGDSGKKYYYKCGNDKAASAAEKKANAQGKAAYASGYNGLSKLSDNETHLSKLKTLVLQLAEKKPTEIQTYIFDKLKFKTIDDVRKWLKKNSLDETASVDETGDSYRVRQKSPDLFLPRSFRTIDITDGIKAVVGHLK